MIILPAIDIIDRKPVRLYQGDYAQKEIVGSSVMELAKNFEQSGAEYIHLVDLDGAKEGKRVNHEIILETAHALDVPVEVGGGIRTMAQIESYLENGIDRFESYYDGFDPYAIATRCRTAALMEVARTSARRAERIYARADLAVGSRESALHRRYLNRLSDYLWAAARYLDAVRQESPSAAPATPRLKELNAVNPMSLSNVKRFMQALEDEAQRRGLQLVIAVCDREGRPVAVHVMDEAFIASYDIAVNKAFTAVSLKMSTKELAKLCAPGGSLYGLQHTNQGRIVIFGGGVTLRDREGNILGGLGVSGSTAEIDTMMGDVGEELFLRMQSR